MTDLRDLKDSTMHDVQPVSDIQEGGMGFGVWGLGREVWGVGFGEWGDVKNGSALI